MQRKIVEYLAPMLGEETALNLVRHYCTRMKMSVEDIRPDHLPQLAETMKPMLAVWLGSAGAARVASELARLSDSTQSK